MKRITKILLFLVALSLPLTGLSAVAQAFSGAGNGTSGSPYQISTCAELEETNNALSADYVLTAPVDCTGVSYVPIGSSSAAFTGNFDGNGFTIDNVTTSAGTNDGGVFGRISGGTISNVIVEDATISAGIQNAGGLAGAVDTAATLSGIQVVNSTISAPTAVGGIVGSLDSSTISHSSVLGGTVNGSVANPTTANNIGGAIGQSTGATITTTSVINTTVNGNDNGSASSSVAGFIGASNGDNMNDSYTTAQVTGEDKVGGFVGASASSGFSRDYAAGTVTGDTNVGGFSGYEGLNGIVDSFAAGTVSGTSHVGGLIGDVEAVGGDATNSYFDVTRTGQSNCVGQDNGISLTTTCTGVNTASAQPNFFFDNSTNGPLAHWNFTTTWLVNQADFPTLISTPQRPNNVKVVRSAKAIAVSWAYPADDGGSPVTGYDFGYRLFGSTGPFTITAGLSIGTLSQTVKGLAPGTQYEFAVRADNTVGAGIWSLFITSTASATSNATAPDTGFGTPGTTNSTLLTISLGSILIIGTGVALLYRREYAVSPAYNSHNS